MSVLSVARGTTDPRASAEDGTPNSPQGVVDIAERFTAKTEAFFTRLWPGSGYIVLDWNTIAPIVSTISAVASVAVLAYQSTLI